MIWWPGLAGEILDDGFEDVVFLRKQSRGCHRYSHIHNVYRQFRKISENESSIIHIFHSTQPEKFEKPKKEINHKFVVLCCWDWGLVVMKWLILYFFVFILGLNGCRQSFWVSFLFVLLFFPLPRHFLSISRYAPRTDEWVKNKRKIEINKNMYI